MIALISPIDRLAEQSFTMHMVQHVLLLDLVPIGLILGLTKVLLRPAPGACWRSSARSARSCTPPSRSCSTSSRCGRGTSPRPTTRR